MGLSDDAAHDNGLRRGLVSPLLRSKANYRPYDDMHVEPLLFIRHCRSLGMTLSEIRTLLACRNIPEANCGRVDAWVDARIDQVAARIAELKRLRRRCNRSASARLWNSASVVGKDAIFSVRIVQIPRLVPELVIILQDIIHLNGR